MRRNYKHPPLYAPRIKYSVIAVKKAGELPAAFQKLSGTKVATVRENVEQILSKIRQYCADVPEEPHREAADDLDASVRSLQETIEDRDCDEKTALLIMVAFEIGMNVQRLVDTIEFSDDVGAGRGKARGGEKSRREDPSELLDFVKSEIEAGRERSLARRARESGKTKLSERHINSILIEKGIRPARPRKKSRQK